MYLKHKFHIYLWCLMVMAQVTYARSLTEMVKDLVSFKVPPDILSSVNDSIVGKIKAKNIRFVLPNKVEIDELEVLDEFHERVLYSPHVALSLSLLSLLTSNIRITDAAIAAPFFRYTVKKDIHNIIRIFEDPPHLAVMGPKPKSKIRVTIEKVSTKDGRFVMEHDAGVVINASGIKAMGKFYVEDGPFGVDIEQANIERGTIKAAGMTLPLANLVAKKLWISDLKVFAEEVTANYERALVKGAGTVYIAEEKYDVKASIDAPPGTYPQGLKPPPFSLPSFKALVAMSGKLVEPQFDATLDMDAFIFNTLPIKQSSIKGVINRHKIKVSSSRLLVGDKGIVTSVGQVDIDQGKFSFSSEISRVLTKELGLFLSFDKPLYGEIFSNATLEGSFMRSEPNIHVKAQGRVVDGGIFDVKFMPQTQFSLDVNYVLDKKVHIHKSVLTDKSGLKLLVSGSGDIPKNSLRLDFDATIMHAKNHVKFFSEHDDINHLKAKGVFNLLADNIDVETTFHARHGQISKIEGEDLSGKLIYRHDDLSALINARIHGGSLRANLMVHKVTKEKRLNGKVDLERADLSPLLKPFSTVPIKGIVTSSLDVHGTLQDPHIDFNADIEDLEVQNISFMRSHLVGKFAAHKLTLAKILAISQTSMVEGSQFTYDTSNQKINGALNISGLSLSQALAAPTISIEGMLSGPINIDGTLLRPIISAPMKVKNLKAYGVTLGSGALSLGLSHQRLLPQDSVSDLVFDVSANLSTQTANSIFRFGYALNQKTINVDGEFRDIDINTADTDLIKYDQIGVSGKFSGHVVAQGPWRSPIIVAEIIGSEYALFDPKMRTLQEHSTEIYGPVIVSASNKNGHLALDLCASFDKPGQKQCNLEKAWQLSLAGPFSFDTYDLQWTSKFSYDRAQDLLFMLRTELTSLNLSAHATGRITKKVKSDPIITGEVTIEKLAASLSKIESLTLKDAVSIAFTHESLRFNNTATLQFHPGQLEIEGLLSKAKIDVNFKGAIPLVLCRPLMPMIQGAEGLARGEISASGSLAKMMLMGRIVPDAGAIITFHKWVDPIEIREGAISFERLSKDSFITKFDGIRLGVGDGRLSIDGNFIKKYSGEKSSGYSSFNLNAHGSNIVFRNKFDFVETDFSIHTEPLDQSSLVARGEIVITDGSAHRQFDLRNFVAEAKGGATAGISDVLDAIDLAIDLDISIRQFKASARMLNLDIESILRGQVTAQGSLAHPKFKGALFVNEGAIVFPALSFDLVESQIVFEENSKTSFDPQIKILATQELDKDAFQIDQDTTVELSLRGNLDKLSLGLRPIRGDMRMSQLKIFLLLLSPQMAANFDSANQSELLKQGAQNAAMALSEVFLRPLTNELQDILEGKTRTRIQFGSSIEPGGVTFRLSWKLGPRLEVQGSYMLVNWDNLRGREKSSLMMENAPLGDIKLKLLLFDHRPLGPLFFESSFGSVRWEDSYEPRGKIRLKYRVLSK